jgi:hypothetical protein
LSVTRIKCEHSLDSEDYSYAYGLSGDEKTDFYKLDTELSSTVFLSAVGEIDANYPYYEFFDVFFYKNCVSDYDGQETMLNTLYNCFELNIESEFNICEKVTGETEKQDENLIYNFDYTLKMVFNSEGLNDVRREIFEQAESYKDHNLENFFSIEISSDYLCWVDDNNNEFEISKVELDFDLFFRNDEEEEFTLASRYAIYKMGGDVLITDNLHELKDEFHYEQNDAGLNEFIQEFLFWALQESEGFLDESKEAFYNRRYPESRGGDDIYKPTLTIKNAFFETYTDEINNIGLYVTPEEVVKCANAIFEEPEPESEETGLQKISFAPLPQDAKFAIFLFIDNGVADGKAKSNSVFEFFKLYSDMTVPGAQDYTIEEQFKPVNLILKSVTPDPSVESIKDGDTIGNWWISGKLEGTPKNHHSISFFVGFPFAPDTGKAERIIYFPGDATGRTMFWLLANIDYTSLMRDTDLLIAPHHGSFTTPSGDITTFDDNNESDPFPILDRFLETVSAKLQIASSGYQNKYGLPNLEYQAAAFRFLAAIPPAKAHWTYTFNGEKEAGVCLSNFQYFTTVATKEGFKDIECDNNNIQAGEINKKNVAYYSYLTTIKAEDATMTLSAHDCLKKNIFLNIQDLTLPSTPIPQLEAVKSKPGPKLTFADFIYDHKGDALWI